MAMTIAFVAIVVAALLFHWLSPWWATPLASNWKQMDDTLTITLIICGIFFIVIHFFVAYCLLRYRHRKGSSAAYIPENKKLERWLIGATSLGIIALLAPGLVVYAEYVTPPPGALIVEVVGQQWQWHFRFPDAEGRLGRSDARFVSAANPFGLDPADAAGQNNLLIKGSELHLPMDQPVKVLLRSHDVLHDFYVPQFRARMNMVPGMVTSFWFTPTVAGRYEILCAQLCGVGHATMRGHVVVEDRLAFQQWLRTQPTFAATMTATTSVATADPLLRQGQSLAQSKGCIACHSIDGSPGVGPTWKGLFGKTESLEGGTEVVADHAYLMRSIREPAAQIVKGYAPIMPTIALSDQELSALLAYIESLGASNAVPTAPTLPTASR